jgi:hypothetical protein
LILIGTGEKAKPSGREDYLCDSASQIFPPHQSLKSSGQTVRSARMHGAVAASACSGVDTSLDMTALLDVSAASDTCVNGPDRSTHLEREVPARLLAGRSTPASSGRPPLSKPVRTPSSNRRQLASQTCEDHSYPSYQTPVRAGLVFSGRAGLLVAGSPLQTPNGPRPSPLPRAALLSPSPSTRTLSAAPSPLLHPHNTSVSSRIDCAERSRTGCSVGRGSVAGGNADLCPTKDDRGAPRRRRLSCLDAAAIFVTLALIVTVCVCFAMVFRYDVPQEECRNLRGVGGLQTSDLSRLHKPGTGIGSHALVANGTHVDVQPKCVPLPLIRTRETLKRPLTARAESMPARPKSGVEARQARRLMQEPSVIGRGRAETPICRCTPKGRRSKTGEEPPDVEVMELVRERGPLINHAAALWGSFALTLATLFTCATNRSRDPSGDSLAGGAAPLPSALWDDPSATSGRAFGLTGAAHAGAQRVRCGIPPPSAQGRGSAPVSTMAPRFAAA